MGKDAVVPGLGYPDMGAGHFSRKLPYGDWFRFNCAQRIHANSIDHLSWSLPILLFNGLFFPKFAATMGSIVFVGRELYRYGYMSPEGPDSHIREAGAIPLNIAEVLLVGGALLTVSRFCFGGFIRNRKLYKRLRVDPIELKVAEVLKKEAKKNNK